MADLKEIGRQYIRNKKEALNSLLEEIEREGYTTVNQIKGSIHGSLDILVDLEKENNK